MNRLISEFLDRIKILKNHFTLGREVSGLFFPMNISGIGKCVPLLRNLLRWSREDFSTSFKHFTFIICSAVLHYKGQDCKIRLHHCESVFDHAEPICRSAIGFAFVQSVPTALQNTLQTRKAGFISAKLTATVQSLLQCCRAYCGSTLFIHDQITLYS